MFIAFEDNLMPTIFDKEFYLSDLELTYLMHWFICDVSQHGSDENEVPLISTHLIGDVTKLCEFASKNKITKTFLVSPSYMNKTAEWSMSRLKSISKASYGDIGDLSQIYRFETQTGDFIQYDLSGLKAVEDKLDFQTILTFG